MCSKEALKNRLSAPKKMEWQISRLIKITTGTARSTQLNAYKVYVIHKYMQALE